MTEIAHLPETNIVPPQNLEAEENILGAILLDNRVIDNISELVSPSDFYRESHGTIYRIACEMYATGKAVDAITMTDELDKRGQLEKVGGRIRLFELAGLVPPTTNTHHYANIVREAAVLRGLIKAGGNISRLGWERPGSIEELLAEAETHLSGVVHDTITSQLTPLDDDITDLFDEITEAYETGSPRMGLLTGYRELDNILSGLHGGQLILIAARPGIGKSALGQNIAENVAERGETVGLWSLEMSKREVQIRALSQHAKVDSRKLRQGKMSADEFERVKAAKPTISGRIAHLLVDDISNASVAQIRAQAKRAARTNNLKLIVVDYLQLMVSSGSKENRTQEISAMSRGLKLLARELNIPVIALSQLNRNLEGRQEKRPMLSDLRESGSLEQDADVVLFIYRDDYYNPTADPATQGIAEIIVAKNRMGPQETVKLAYVKQTTTFKNLPQP